MIAPRRVFATFVVLAGLVAAGCGGSPPPTAKVGAGTTVTVPPSTGSTTAATTMPGTPTTTRATNTMPTTPAVSACATSMLNATLSNENGAAGTIYYHLVFTNTSTKICTIQGYPGVSFVDGTGHQIGAPVPRDTTSTFGGVVTLGSGSSAGALFALHDAYVGSVSGCTGTTAAALKVYPPNQTAALSVTAPLQVCSNPATPGSASVTAVTSLANLPG